MSCGRTEFYEVRPPRRRKKMGAGALELLFPRCLCVSAVKKILERHRDSLGLDCVSSGTIEVGFGLGDVGLGADFTASGGNKAGLALQHWRAPLSAASYCLRATLACASAVCCCVAPSRRRYARRRRWRPGSRSVWRQRPPASPALRRIRNWRVRPPLPERCWGRMRRCRHGRCAIGFG